MDAHQTAQADQKSNLHTLLVLLLRTEQFVKLFSIAAGPLTSADVKTMREKFNEIAELVIELDKKQIKPALSTRLSAGLIECFTIARQEGVNPVFVSHVERHYNPTHWHAILAAKKALSPQHYGRIER